MSEKQLIILGASARAACFSARRSSFSPYWIDQYGDHDLVNNFPGECVPVDDYPAGILDLIKYSPVAPFLYTGAMENHLQVLAALEKERTLLGNSAAVCRAVRDPWRLAECFHQSEIKYPQISIPDKEAKLNDKDWLLKPVRGAGGMGVMHYRETTGNLTESHYLQEFISGESRAGVFVGDGESACLLGVTRQLVGEAFLNAEEFSYCGSIGPLKLHEDENEQWQHIGHSLTAEFGLKGLFGVDAICHAGDIYPLEVNPRYTASVEVVELALQLPVIAMHCDACKGILPSSILPVDKLMMGKAYLFAHQDLISPGNVQELYYDIDGFPLTADIPQADRLISQGHPVMTLIAREINQEKVMQSLISRAKLLYNKFDAV